MVLHPNGFCAGMFHPLALDLRDRYRVIGIDLRGHGDSEVVTDPTCLGNDSMADDVLMVIDHLDIGSFDLLGVSLGGGIAVVVAAEAPGLVRSLLLCEAIAFGPEFTAVQDSDGSAGARSMAEKALYRKRVWANREAVKNSYGSRPPLNVLAPEVLEAYIRWGFDDLCDGRVQLSCQPETEALIFGRSRPNGPEYSFRRLADVRCRTSVLYGSSTNLPVRWFLDQAERLEGTPLLVDGGHFFLFEDLKRANTLIRHLLD